jgi:hypothetical protein
VSLSCREVTCARAFGGAHGRFVAPAQYRYRTSSEPLTGPALFYLSPLPSHEGLSGNPAKVAVVAASPDAVNLACAIATAKQVDGAIRVRHGPGAEHARAGAAALARARSERARSVVQKQNGATCSM